MIVADLADILDERLSFDRAPDWDPVGLTIGWPDAPVGRVAVCHEITEVIVDRAERDGLDTVVAYHPLLFTPPASLLAGPTAAGRALRLARIGCSVIVVHTALDMASPGTADAAIEALGLTTSGSFACEAPDTPPFGRWAELGDPLDARELGRLVEGRFGDAARIADAGVPITRVGVLPGSGGSFLDQAHGVVDAVVTGDVSHHRASAARAAGVTVIDIGHSATERAGVESLYAAVREAVPSAEHWKDDPTPWER